MAPPTVAAELSSPKLGVVSVIDAVAAADAAPTAAKIPDATAAPRPVTQTTKRSKGSRTQREVNNQVRTAHFERKRLHCESFGVVARSYQQGADGVGADAVTGQERWGSALTAASASSLAVPSFSKASAIRAMVTSSTGTRGGRGGPFGSSLGSVTG